MVTECIRQNRPRRELFCGMSVGRLTSVCLQSTSSPAVRASHMTAECLEIMSPSTRHERLNRRIATLCEVIAEECNIELDNVGSNTFKREDLARGFEPDSCFTCSMWSTSETESRLTWQLTRPRPGDRNRYQPFIAGPFSDLCQHRGARGVAL